MDENVGPASYNPPRNKPEPTESQWEARRKEIEANPTPDAIARMARYSAAKAARAAAESAAKAARAAAAAAPPAGRRSKTKKGARRTKKAGRRRGTKRK